MSFTVLREISFGENELGFVSDAEIGAAIADIQPRRRGRTNTAAFAHTGRLIHRPLG